MDYLLPSRNSWNPLLITKCFFRTLETARNTTKKHFGVRKIDLSLFVLIPLQKNRLLFPCLFCALNAVLVNFPVTRSFRVVLCSSRGFDELLPLNSKAYCLWVRLKWLLQDFGSCPDDPFLFCFVFSHELFVFPYSPQLPCASQFACSQCSRGLPTFFLYSVPVPFMLHSSWETLPVFSSLVMSWISHIALTSI